MKNFVFALAIVAVLIVAGCVEKETPPANNTTLEMPALNQSGQPIVPGAEEMVVVPEKEPLDKVIDYLAAHPISSFSGLDTRLIEIEFEGNKSMLRFRTSTSNPNQESVYLLGVQLLVFPDIAVANSTGYNPEGKIIMSPDSRTEASRSVYWKKYRAQTDWFPNLEVESECKVDADCNDKNACTIDKCLSDEFCSNVKIVKAECV